MFARKGVALLAAVAMAGGMLSFSGAPAGAQALRLGLVNPDALKSEAAVDTVAYRGGYRGPARVGRVGGYRGPMRVGGVYRGPMRVGGVYRGPVRVGPRYAAGYRPGWGPGPVRPGWGPGRPGWGPGGPGWGHPGWRPPPGAWGPGPWRPGWGWYRPGWGWGYYDNGGAWIALGVASAVAVGAAAAAANTPVYDDAVAYCMQRFRSYNPATGTYTGYDGLQHPCP
ncbi:BA14K family protein [Xanthobacter autotrophicus DSM 431]|uniref:BA14K family protein n=1 Tax=Xanthobacter nonsaccharivorans TaxID=3119912 RepID=UPI00372AD4B6